MTAAYYSALVAALPELLRICPDLRTSEDAPDELASGSTTEVYTELVQLREEMLATGAFNRQERRQLARDANAAATAEPIPSLSLPLTLSQPPSSPAHVAIVSAAVPTASMHAPPQSSSSSTILNKDTDALWRAASIHARGGIDSMANKFMPAMMLQKDITAALENQLQKQMLVQLGTYQQSIVRSLSAGPQSGAFLTVLPTERAYRLSDEQMRLAIRHRLGMLPALSLRADSCLSCHARNTVTEPQFITDPHRIAPCQHSYSL